MSERIASIGKIRRIADHPRQMIMQFSESKTKQAPAEACDINSIMARMLKGGSAMFNRMQGIYADVSNLAGFDYGTAQTVLETVRDQFMLLPANVREFFRNDPQTFLEFCGKSENRAKAVELGLIVEDKAVTDESKVVVSPQV